MGSAALPALALLLAATLATGCRGRALAPSEADAVREQLALRTRERDAARARVAELETELARRSAPSAANDPANDPELAAATPALASVAVSGLSAATLVDANNANLSLVLVPTDGLGRFLQVAGTLRISVAAIVAGEPPQPSATRTLGPKAMRDAYRSGFMGTHYTVEMPVAWTGAREASALSVSVEFTDGATGRAFPAVATMRMLPPKSARAGDR
ncbi:MAG: hypothetical protein ACKOYN_09260 [Planctomycetota bacterium]